MKLHIIFDSRRQEKYEPLIQEMNRQGIEDFEIFPCIMLPDVVSAINASFKMLIRYAKEQGLKEIAIAEDDLFFPASDGWQYFIKNKPDDYDIYVAGNYLINNPEEYAEPLIKVKEYVGNHCIIVNSRYYDKWLSIPDDRHCDTAHSGMGDFYVCFPFAALQRPGFSSNNKTEVNYNAILRPEWIYK